MSTHLWRILVIISCCFVSWAHFDISRSSYLRKSGASHLDSIFHIQPLRRMSGDYLEFSACLKAAHISGSWSSSIIKATKDLHFGIRCSAFAVFLQLTLFIRLFTLIMTRVLTTQKVKSIRSQSHGAITETQAAKYAQLPSAQRNCGSHHYDLKNPLQWRPPKLLSMSPSDNSGWTVSSTTKLKLNLCLCVTGEWVTG